jgi:hypothetical protein
MSADEIWEENINPILHDVIGWGDTVSELALKVRRGLYGMEGFCKWAKTCIK